MTTADPKPTTPRDLVALTATSVPAITKIVRSSLRLWGLAGSGGGSFFDSSPVGSRPTSCSRRVVEPGPGLTALASGCVLKPSWAHPP